MQSLPEIRCAPVPVWLGMISNTEERTYLTELNYTCDEGMEFEDRDPWRVSTCNLTGHWNPPLVMCNGKPASTAADNKYVCTIHMYIALMQVTVIEILDSAYCSTLAFSFLQIVFKTANTHRTCWCNWNRHFAKHSFFTNCKR